MKCLVLIAASITISILTFAATPAPSEAIKPLWTKTPSQWFQKPSATSTQISCQPLRWTKTGDIVYGTYTAGKKLSGFALVAGNSGELLDNFLIQPQPEGRREFISSTTPMPDGRILVATITDKIKPPPGVHAEGACVLLRVFDPSQKKLKLTFQKQIAYDDPTSGSESGPVSNGRGWGPGADDPIVQAYPFQKRVAIVTAYYLIEFDAVSWKPLHGTRMKGGSDYQILLRTGVMWGSKIMGDRHGTGVMGEIGQNWFMADYGSDIRAISKENADSARASNRIPTHPYMKSDPQLTRKRVDGALKFEFAQRKLEVELPSPANSVGAYSTTDFCVVRISCEKGEEVHCVLKLPVN